MRYLAVIFFTLLYITHSLAQERQIQGIVFDRESKQRLTRVYIYNTHIHKGVFNNGKGEFTINASKGDTLIAALEGYGIDTLTVPAQNTVLFYLQRNSIRLKEVIIRDTLKSPQKQLEETQKEYADIYRKGNAKDIFSIGGANGVGAGLSIDALYNLLSKEGKNARYLQQIIERDYRDLIINYRYTKTLVNNVTGLTGKQLADFMDQYRPSYYFILDANDYALIRFIKESYQRYLKNPDANRLPPLKEPE